MALLPMRVLKAKELELGCAQQRQSRVALSEWRAGCMVVKFCKQSQAIVVGECGRKSVRAGGQRENLEARVVGINPLL